MRQQFESRQEIVVVGYFAGYNQKGTKHGLVDSIGRERSKFERVDTSDGDEAIAGHN